MLSLLVYFCSANAQNDTDIFGCFEYDQLKLQLGWEHMNIIKD